MNPMLIKITDVNHIRDFILNVTFNTGEQKQIDLKDHLCGEVFEPLKDPDVFSKFTLNDFTIEWPNGADFAPEFLYEIALEKSHAVMHK